MSTTIKLLGTLIILAGISIMIFPESVFSWIENSVENPSFRIIAIVGRFILGILLIAAAKESRHPIIIKFFGFLSIIAAIVFIFIGQDSFKEFFSSLLPYFKPFSLVSGLVAAAVGAFLWYEFSKKRE